MQSEPENSRGMISFHVDWIPELNEVALYTKHFAEGGGHGVEESCMLIPRALAIELRYALDRALQNASPGR